jgi:hypothetical protein
MNFLEIASSTHLFQSFELLVSSTLLDIVGYKKILTAGFNFVFFKNNTNILLF